MALTTFVAGNVLTAAQLNDSFAAIGGLRLIKKETIGSAVSTVSLTSVFSAAYQNYLVHINVDAASTSSVLRVRIGNAATGYYTAAFGLSFAAGGANVAQSNDTEIDAGIINTSGGDTIMQIFNPFETRRTTFTFQFAELLTSGVARTGAGFLNNTNSYTDLEVFPQTGTYTGGTIYVYGYGITV